MDLGRPLHWLAGFGLGLIFRPFPYKVRWQIGGRLEDWAWKREHRQNEAGKDPNFPLSDKQQAEAKAWGNGYRAASGVT